MLNRICSNLETSKRLKELGIETETDLAYFTPFAPSTKTGSSVVTGYTSNKSLSYYMPCYTLEQILEILPRQIIVKGKEWHFDLEHGQICYENGLVEPDYDLIYVTDRGTDNLVTTAALLLIELIEDKII